LKVSCKSAISLVLLLLNVYEPVDEVQLAIGIGYWGMNGREGREWDYLRLILGLCRDDTMN
jgi:hypothetical protein